MDGRRTLGDRYRLEEPLGAGGMSEVWRADDAVLGRKVAVKLLSGSHATDPASRQRIRVEARTVAALSHPNIAQVFDYGEAIENGVYVPYVVMELLEGGTLEERALEGPVPPQLAFRVCAQVGAALAAAHAAGLVHRDVKPANVMLTPLGAKVVDFGIAASVSPSTAVDPDGQLLGTPAYLAPERLTDDAVEPASDVYSLGVLLYKLLAGRLPWSAATTTQLLTDHVFTEPEPLPPLPGVPDAVARLCTACLAKDPADRPSAQRVAAVLAAATTDLPPEPAAHRPAGHGRRRLLVAAAAVSVCAVVAAWLVNRPAEPAGAEHAQAEAAGAAVPGAVGSGSPGGARPSGTAAPGGGLPGGAGTDAAALPGPTVADVGIPPAGSASPQPGGSSGAPPTTDAPGTTTFTSEGGTVGATCPADDLAKLVSWSPARSYVVDHHSAGPAPAAWVRFRRGQLLVTMTVRCSGGSPTASVERTQTTPTPTVVP